MSEFGIELTRLMAEREVGVRQLARAVYCNPGHISNLRSGKARPSPELAAGLDRHLGAGGTLETAAQQPGRWRRHTGTRGKPSRAVEALQVAMSGGDDGGFDAAEDGLAELVRHYAYAVAIAPSAAVYDELLSARSFAGTLLHRGAPRRRPELAVTTGWLSSLLAISATDLGDHAAAVVWCADTERRSREGAHPNWQDGPP